MYEINKYSPCKKALIFRAKFKTFQEAWQACPRGDWMLWIADKVGVDKKLLTLAKGMCAGTVRHLMKDERSLKAVDTAIAYGRGKATKEQLDAAADAADAAAYDADAYDAAAYAATDAYDAADVYAATDAARVKNQKQTADICRDILTVEIMKLINLN